MVLNIVHTNILIGQVELEDLSHKTNSDESLKAYQSLFI